MASLFRSFMDAVIPPPPRKAPEGQRPWATSTSGHPKPEESRPEESRKPQQASSRIDLEQRRVTNDPDVLDDDQQVEVEDLGPESEEDEQEQRNPLDPGNLASQITVRRPRSTLAPVIPMQDKSGLEDSKAPETTGEEESTSGLLTRDLIEDAKFYQDVAIELQTAYDTLQNRFTQQACLMEEASGALHAAETQASKRQQELLKLQNDREADIQLAVSAKQSLDTESSLQPLSRSSKLRTVSTNRQSISCKTGCKPWELSVASHATLPSVRPTKDEADLWEDIFNYLPGTVNTRRGTVVYKSQDQPFSFRKQVRFGDRSQRPDLKSDADSDDQQISPPTTPHSSTPHRGVRPRNQTFDMSVTFWIWLVSHMMQQPLQLKFQQQQRLKHQRSFTRMRDPKITKFKGGYLADAELTFRSWRADIITHIQDRELDNKAAIQLIKDMTQDNAAVKWNSNLTFAAGSSRIKTCSNT